MGRGISNVLFVVLVGISDLLLVVGVGVSDLLLVVGVGVSELLLVVGVGVSELLLVLGWISVTYRLRGPQSPGVNLHTAWHDRWRSTSTLLKPSHCILNAPGYRYLARNTCKGGGRGRSSYLIVKHDQL